MAIFTYFDGLDPTGTITGDSSIDTIQLQTNANANPNSDFLTFDLTQLEVESIEQIRFSPHAGDGHDLMLQLNGDEFDNVPVDEFAANLHIIGHDVIGYREIITIHMNVATTLDISGWTFQDWGGQGDEIYVFGTSSDETVRGTSQRDWIFGYAGADVLYGNDGRDDLSGGIGKDQLFGGAGNDELHGGDGDDTLYGGDGADRLMGEAGDDVLYGDAGGDTLIDDAGVNALYGGDGNDSLLYRDGRDVPAGALADGGAGTDTLQLSGGLGTDLLFDLGLLDASSIERISFQPVLGADLTVALAAAELVPQGGIATNAIINGRDAPGYTETIRITMGTVDDLNLSGWTFTNWGAQGETVQIFGDATPETIRGTSSADVINGGKANDFLYGQGGDDRLYGGLGNDEVYGGTGSDRVKGNFGDDLLRGGDGVDWIWGGGANDTMRGDGGNDRLYGQNGDDVLKGDDGSDRLKGHNGNDTLYGGAGNDALYGGTHDDHLFGNVGNDWLLGGSGNDLLNGNTGNDKLWGQGGIDTFRYNPGGDTDIIKDFENDVDAIDLSAWGFATVSDALAHAMQTGAHVKFDFTGVSGAGPTDRLWVLNVTIAQLADDIIV